MVDTILTHLSENAVLVLFLLVGLGMLLGHIKVKGVSLGAAAVLFTGIGLAAWGSARGIMIEVPHEIGILIASPFFVAEIFR